MKSDVLPFHWFITKERIKLDMLTQSASLCLYCILNAIEPGRISAMEKSIDVNEVTLLETIKKGNVLYHVVSVLCWCCDVCIAAGQREGLEMVTIVVTRTVLPRHIGERKGFESGSFTLWRFGHHLPQRMIRRLE